MDRLRMATPPWIVGHRGVRGPVPENTPASVREAVAQGVDMVEIDLQLTAAGELVVYHDAEVSLAPDERKPVARLTRDDRRRCRLAWQGEGRRELFELPLLEDLLSAAPPDLPFNLEIKWRDPKQDAAPLAETLAAALDDRPGVLVSSFDWPALAALRRRCPDLPLAPLAGESAAWPEVLAAARRLRAFSIHLHRRLAGRLGEAGELDGAAARERPILVYTVNDGSLAKRLFAGGVTGFFTDRPAALRAALA